MLRLKFDPASASEELARDEAMLVWADSIVENENANQPTAPSPPGIGGGTVSRLGASPGSHDGTDSRSGTGASAQTANSKMAFEYNRTELFRTWSFQRPTVVLGRSSKIDEEVDREFCESQSIEVLRRCTGGASVVGGPGCLMYSVVIATPSDGELRKIDVAHDYVMQRVLSAVQTQMPTAERLGICDLTMNEKKFSGNSLRVARHHLLYHGTILLSSDLPLVARCLDHAPRQPEYRRGRDHGEFVTNTGLDESRLIDSLVESFEATDHAKPELHAAIETVARGLLTSRYDDPSWHTRR